MPTKKKTALGQAGKTVVVPTIIKRDGRIVPFDLEKIVNAVAKGMNTVHEGSLDDARRVANQVFAEMLRIKRKFKNFLPTVEGTQDLVEQELMRADFVKTAKHYVLYREQRAKLRADARSGVDALQRAKFGAAVETARHHFRQHGHAHRVRGLDGARQIE